MVTRSNLIWFFGLLILVVSLSRCYYDNEEKLYPGGGECDTTNITYSGTIIPVLDVNCYSCHNSVNPSGGVILNTYSELIKHINNGSFQGSINHEAGFSPMPSGGEKLSDCFLLKTDVWIENGFPDN